MSNAWNQMDGLLTCPMCNERYRNPKLLPCQHTFCMEPCIEKLTTEGSKHQLKCPDCGAEHRVPFHGIQAFPNNVTLTRFLELRVSLNGDNPEPPPSMQRCAICNEKERLEKCCHCNKKVCQSCRKAHSSILKQEIMLINGQVKTGLENLSGTLSQTQKNKDKIQDNRRQVKNKIEELVNRYISDLAETEAKLKHELDVYLYCELHNIKKLKHDLELEINNITSNCELVEKHMNNGIEWTDAELVDYKEIFQRALDFVRNFEVDTSDYSRRVRFHPKTDTEAFRKTLKEFGEVKDCPVVIATPLQNGLIMRSQSDHRLAMQHQRQEDSLQGSELSRRRFDRNARECSVERELGRHGSEDYLSPWRRDEALRNRAQSRECSPEPPRIVEERPERIIETEDATKGPISKVVRLMDSGHMMAKMHQTEVRQKQQQKEQERKSQQPPPRPVTTYQPRQLQRQTSEDDVDKQKKQNQAAAAAAEGTAASSGRGRTPKPREEVLLRSSRTSTETETSAADGSRRESQKPPVSPRQSLQPLRPPRVPAGRSNSIENAEDKTHPTSSRPKLTPLTVTAPDKTEEPRKKPFYSRFLNRNKEAEKKSSSSDSSSDSSDDDAQTNKSNRGDMSPSVSELLARSAQARRQSITSQQNLGLRTSPLYPSTEDRSSRSWRDSVRRDNDSTTKESLVSRRRRQAEEPEEEVSYTRYSERRKSLAAVEPAGSSGSRYRNRISRSKSSHDIALGEESADEELSTARSRLRQSRSAREISPARESGSWSQYLKNKYGQRNRPSPSGGTGTDNSSDEEEKVVNRRRDSLLSRYGDNYGTAVSRRAFMQKGKSTLKFGARGSEPGCFTWPRGVAVGQDLIAVADSSNHRVQIFNSNGKFLHEFGSYGSGEGEFDCLAAVTVAKSGHYVISDRYNHRLQVFDPSGRFVRSFGTEGRADGKFNYPWGLAVDSLGFIYICDKENHRIQVFQIDGTYVSKFGSVGSRPGELEHPHYVAVSNTNRVIVSDSNNHRIQIFDVNGRLLSTFGSEGTEEGQFRFPRGVAVDDQGYVIVGDSGNNRIQIFHPDGSFLKAFGSWGCGDGEFKGLEGIAVNSNSGILVCDRENHRIQVF